MTKVFPELTEKSCAVVYRGRLSQYILLLIIMVSVPSQPSAVQNSALLAAMSDDVQSLERRRRSAMTKYRHMIEVGL